MRALYVEDNALDADLARRALARAARPIELDVAPTVGQAIQMLTKHPTAYQWVLFDLSLPDGDGLQVLRHVREHQLPVTAVAVTGTGDERAVIQALKLGVDDYVIKQGDYLERLPALLNDVHERLNLSDWRHEKPLRVLYAEHSAHDGQLAARHLASSAPHLKLDVVTDAQLSLTELQTAEPPYDVLLLDYRLIDLNALELTKRVRSELGLDIPIVIVTGLGSEEVAAQALRLGVTDYLIKDNHYLQRLPGILEFAYAKAQLMRERARLRDNEAELLKLTQQVPGVITVTRYKPGSRRGTTPFASDALQSIFEYSHREVRDDSTRFADRIHPDDLERVNLVLQKVINQLTATTCEYRLILPRQGERWVESQVTPQQVADGSVRLYSYTFDISDRKAAEALLLKSEADLRKLTEQVPGVIVVTHHRPDGFATTRYASAALHDVFELTFDDVRNDARQFGKRVHPDDQANVTARYLHMRHQMSRGALEYRAILPTKGLRWLEWQMTPELQPDGSMLLYSYTFDITERKQYAEVLFAAEASERANRAKTEFLSRMSHELRTPLNAVIGFSQILQMDQKPPLGPHQLRQIGLIEQAGTHLLEMITDVLDLSRIEAGSLPMSLESIRIVQASQDAVNLVGEMARRAQVDVTVAPHTGDPHVHADQLRLRQVLVNLLSNAIKYNRPQGQVTIRIEAEASQVAIHVLDTGMGLSPAQQAHLFEPFNRLGAERTGVEGTGIGLVIVHRLIELMHGQMNVTSTVGVGSCFTVRLPLAQALSALALSAPVLEVPPQAQRTFSVLYAEDNEINIDLVRQVMAMREGCDLRIARSGMEAIQMAQSAPPDILLLDMHLGDMDGLAVAQALQDDVRLQHTPRIALSADALPDQIRKAREHGFAAYLTKPMQIAELLSCIDEHLPKPP